MRALGFFILLIPAMLVSCDRGTHWPPAVSSAEEVRALPEDQKDLRGIDCGDDQVRAVAERLTRLEYLYLNSNSPVSDSGVASMKSLTSLRQLVIENASNLTDASAEVFGSMPALRELMLEKAERLTDAALIPLARNSKLRRIYLGGSTSLTPAGVDQLRRSLPGCEVRTE